MSNIFQYTFSTKAICEPIHHQKNNKYYKKPNNKDIIVIDDNCN